MSVFKCKMCGANLTLNGNFTFTTCESCLTLQTLPRLFDEKLVRLYDRANHFRRNNDFDKAMAIYEQILEENNEDAESYWSIMLCKYGIAYVEDPSTQKRIPTINRTQYTSIFDDEDYKAALRYADDTQKSIYEDEATTINEIQKNILDISQREEPFDVFICYKETDENGMRTYDSVYANELYHELTEEGFKVFFSRITLEDILGNAYEPYIFSALNSAKVMVVIGTKPEYFNAVWVKNEWSRYLALIKKGEKKTLIPAYRDMDPYYLPKEFSNLQAQDMNKLGFMPDLIRGIKKLMGRYNDFVAYGFSDDSDSYAYQKVVSAQRKLETESLLKRLKLFLQHAEWESADVYCDKVLDIDPENAQAHICKLLVQLHITDEESLKYSLKNIEHLQSYKNALRFGDDETVERLLKYNDIIKDNIKRRRYDEEMQRIAVEQQQQTKKIRDDLIKNKIRIEEEYIALLAKKRNIEFNIEANRKNATETAKKKKRLQLWGILTIIGAVLPFVLVDSFLSILFMPSFVLMLIISGFLFKVNGKTLWLICLSFITIGIFSLIYAIVSLKKSGTIKKVDISRINENYKNLNSELTQIDADINKNRQELAYNAQNIAALNNKD